MSAYTTTNISRPHAEGLIQRIFQKQIDELQELTDAQLEVMLRELNLSGEHDEILGKLSDYKISQF